MGLKILYSRRKIRTTLDDVIRDATSSHAADGTQSVASPALMASFVGVSASSRTDLHKTGITSDTKQRNRLLASASLCNSNVKEQTANDSHAQLRQWNDIVMKPTKWKQMLGRSATMKQVSDSTGATISVDNLMPELTDKVIIVICSCCCCSCELVCSSDAL